MCKPQYLLVVTLVGLELIFGTIGCSSTHLTTTEATPYGSATDSPYLAQANVGSTPGVRIPSDFMGLSHEWGLAQSMMGDSAHGRNYIYEQLLHNLQLPDHKSILIRIGGHSTDLTTGPEDTLGLQELATSLGVQFYLGVNLAADDATLAISQASSYLARMPNGSLRAIEIGNEPDNYIQLGERPPDYTGQEYLNEFQQWRSNIQASVTQPVQFVGPSWGTKQYLSDYVTKFLKTQHSGLDAFSFHYYVTSVCGGETHPKDYLLSPSAVISGPSLIEGSVIDSHNYDTPFRIDELNSVACGGEDGVSNSLASALWAIDIMFEYASRGVDGVNWQDVDGMPYSAFDFDSEVTSNGNTFSLRRVNPLYYGLLLFQSATKGNAKLLPVYLSSDSNVKAWATIDGAGLKHVVLLNKNTSRAGIVQIEVAGFHHASIGRLKGPSFDAKSGLFLFGQTFDGSEDGKPIGTADFEKEDSQSGIFDVELPSASAVVIDFTE